MKMKIAFGVLAVVTMLTAGVLSGTVHADYPGPSGSVEIVAANTTANPGDIVGFTANVLDVNGNPVANATCTIVITNQPGTDAGVVQSSGETDANGVITGTVNLGSSPGSVVVNIACPVGEGSNQTVSATATFVVADSSGPSSPPGSLPSTGTGLATSNGGEYAQLAIALAVIGVILTVLGVVRQTTQQRARRV